MGSDCINGSYVFHPNYNRGDGFGPRRWNFFELIAKRIATFNRDSRVSLISHKQRLNRMLCTCGRSVRPGCMQKGWCVHGSYTEVVSAGVVKAAPVTQPTTCRSLSSTVGPWLQSLVPVPPSVVAVDPSVALLAGVVCVLSDSFL